MCNDYGNRISYSRYVEEFSHLKLPLFVQGNGPDLTPRDDIRIRDTAPIILRTKDGVELTERVWAPRAANKKTVFNFRSEKRNFGKSTRCLIPASHFFEFTAPADRKQKRRTNGVSRSPVQIGSVSPASSGRMPSTAPPASPC
jgi:putative SOS response-associated peptidase YedK